VQDEAGRELLGLLAAMNNDYAQALVAYLGLFRSTHRDLSNAKALQLAIEVAKLGCNSALLIAMRKTTDSLRSKESKPLSNHNYLKSVLADVEAELHVPSVRRDTPLGVSGVTHTVPEQRPIHIFKTSKTAQALQSLEDFGNE